MSSELNSVQESIKLALDAADAATDVTSEYSQVKREHKKLEQKVSQIHRYTTMTFVTAMVTAVVCLVFFATLYFQTISQLKAMSDTNLEGVVVFPVSGLPIGKPRLTKPNKGSIPAAPRASFKMCA